MSKFAPNCGFWATVCKTVHRMLSVRSLSVLSVLSVLPVLSVLCVCNVRALWTNAWTDQDVQVGLGPGHIVLDGDPAPPPPKGHSPRNFRPMSIVAKRLDGLRCHLVSWR